MYWDACMKLLCDDEMHTFIQYYVVYIVCDI